MISYFASVEINALYFQSLGNMDIISLNYHQNYVLTYVPLND